MKKALVVLISMILLLLTACGSNQDSDETVAKLLEISTLTCEDDIYYFTNSEEGWVIGYADSNEFIKFEDAEVAACAESVLGKGCMYDGESSFSYDISDNEVRMYTDVDTEDGDLSIVSYNIDDEEFILMLDGENYVVAGGYVDALVKEGFLDLVLNEVIAFEEMLAEYDLTFDDLYGVSYRSLSEYL